MTGPGFTEISNPGRLVATPRVSVYVAAYRHEKYLRQAVESVLAQDTPFVIEVVIGEDCSPDGTRGIALALQEAYPEQVRVIAGDVNVGGLRNSTRCLPLCRGEYIAYCEGDDFWHDPAKLRLQIEAMDADRRIMLCHTDYDRLIGRRRKEAMHARAPSRHLANGDAYEALLHEWTVMTVTCVYRASLIHEFLKTPFNRMDWPFGDYPKALFASTHGRVAYIPRSTGTWRKVRGSMSNAGFAATLRLRTAGLECKKAFMEEWPVSRQTQESVYDMAGRVIMHDAFLADDLGAFRLGRSLLAPGASGALSGLWGDIAMRMRIPVAIARSWRRMLMRLTTHAL